MSPARETEMKIKRVELACTGCGDPVGAWVNTERHKSLAEQSPSYIPICGHCADLCYANNITPRRLRNLIQRKAIGVLKYALDYAAN